MDVLLKTGILHFSCTSTVPIDLICRLKFYRETVSETQDSNRRIRHLSKNEIDLSLDYETPEMIGGNLVDQTNMHDETH